MPGSKWDRASPDRRLPVSALVNSVDYQVGGRQRFIWDDLNHGALLLVRLSLCSVYCSEDKYTSLLHLPSIQRELHDRVFAILDGFEIPFTPICQFALYAKAGISVFSLFLRKRLIAHTGIPRL